MAIVETEGHSTESLEIGIHVAEEEQAAVLSIEHRHVPYLFLRMERPLGVVVLAGLIAFQLYMTGMYHTLY